MKTVYRFLLFLGQFITLGELEAACKVGGSSASPVPEPLRRQHQIEVLEITRSLTKSRGTSMIVALHDLNLAYTYSDTVIVLNHGRVHAHGRPEDVLVPGTIREVYGVDAMIVESDYGRHIVPLKVKS